VDGRDYLAYLEIFWDELNLMLMVMGWGKMGWFMDDGWGFGGEETGGAVDFLD